MRRDADIEFAETRPVGTRPIADENGDKRDGLPKGIRVSEPGKLRGKYGNGPNSPRKTYGAGCARLLKAVGYGFDDYEKDEKTERAFADFIKAYMRLDIIDKLLIAMLMTNIPGSDRCRSIVEFARPENWLPKSLVDYLSFNSPVIRLVVEELERIENRNGFGRNGRRMRKLLEVLRSGVYVFDPERGGFITKQSAYDRMKKLERYFSHQMFGHNPNVFVNWMLSPTVF